MTNLDKRVLAFDEGRRLAEERARGHLNHLEGGWRYVTPERRLNGNRRLSFRARPESDAPQVTEALPGEALELLWKEGGWARVRTVHDGYLGWVREGELGAELVDTVAGSDWLMVTALRAHAFAGPKVSQPIVAELCLGASVGRGPGEVVTEDGRRWVPVVLPEGQAVWVQEVCFAPMVGDVVELALRFLETPYVWGGRSAWGLDCSGLVQVVYGAFGVTLPRDADQQQAAVEAVDVPEAGDLAFFPGHVGLMLDERRMIHANATQMRVTIETLGEGEYGKRLAAGCTGFGRPL